MLLLKKKLEGGGGEGMPERVKEDRMRGRGGSKKNLREEVGRRGVKKKKMPGVLPKKIEGGGYAGEGLRRRNAGGGVS